MSLSADSGSSAKREGETDLGERLDSWKAIAAYLEREARTVQRWEKAESLPIHRHLHGKLGSVYAFTAELDEWRRSRRIGSAKTDKDEDVSPAFIQLVEMPAGPAPPPVARFTTKKKMAAAVVCCVIGALVFLLIRKREAVTIYEPVPLTTYGGLQFSPSFSPDGSSIAYSWLAPRQKQFQIYTEAIGSSNPVQISTARGGFRPAWSPDGGTIAFLRDEGDSKTGLWLYNLQSKSERRLRELAGTYGPIDMTLSWTSAGKGLIVPENTSARKAGGLYYVPVDGGEDVWLTRPHHAQGDPNGVVSPDGRELVFTRSFGDGSKQLCVLRLSAEHKPMGEPRKIEWSGFEDSWTSEPEFWGNDGELLFLSDKSGREEIWRVRQLQDTPEHVGIAIAKIRGFAASQASHRLVYGLDRSDANIWRIDASALLDNHRQENHPQEPEEVVASTELDLRPQVSRDGSQIAFESDRSGVAQIWKQDLKTGADFEVTHFRRGGAGSPCWSPDGKAIAFDGEAKGQIQIYRISAGGGRAQQLTFNGSANKVPTWSSDGHWIYFFSTRSGSPQIWRIPAQGGKAEQITKAGGLDSRMSPDGAFLYYSKDYENSSLWRVPSTGGQEIRVIPSIIWRGFALGREGIFFIAPVQPNGYELRYLPFGTETARSLYRFPAEPIPPIAFDGRFIYFSQYDQRGSTLMMVENFQ